MRFLETLTAGGSAGARTVRPMRSLPQLSIPS